MYGELCVVKHNYMCWLATAIPSPPTSDRAAISANPRRSSLRIARQVGHITRLVITAALLQQVSVSRGVGTELMFL